MQIMSNVMSVDGENDPDVLSITGASAALMVSGHAVQRPHRRGASGDDRRRIDSDADMEQMQESTLDLIVAGSHEAF